MKNFEGKPKKEIIIEIDKMTEEGRLRLEEKREEYKKRIEEQDRVIKEAQYLKKDALVKDAIAELVLRKGDNIDIFQVRSFVENMKKNFKGEGVEMTEGEIDKLIEESLKVIMNYAYGYFGRNTK